MRIILFAKAFAVFTTLAMIGVFLAPYVFGEYQATEILFRFLQFEALALALSIIATAAIPHFFGVLKGEDVLMVTKDPIGNRTVFKLAKAINGGKLGSEIKVTNGADGEIVTVESYSGIVTPARVSSKPEANIKVI